MIKTKSYLTLLLFSLTTIAQNYSSVQSGSFNDCETWGNPTGGIEQHITSNTVNFTIAAGHSVTIPDNVSVSADELSFGGATSKLIFGGSNATLKLTSDGTDINCGAPVNLNDFGDNPQNVQLNYVDITPNNYDVAGTVPNVYFGTDPTAFVYLNRSLRTANVILRDANGDKLYLDGTLVVELVGSGQFSRRGGSGFQQVTFEFRFIAKVFGRNGADPWTQLGTSEAVVAAVASSTTLFGQIREELNITINSSSYDDIRIQTTSERLSTVASPNNDFEVLTSSTYALPHPLINFNGSLHR
jgi:hypothetical protein